MISLAQWAALAALGTLGSPADSPAPAPAPSAPTEARADYDRAKAEAGRTPADQVKLALWCESRGLTAERARHLALAVLADPTNAVARGLLGVVARDGRWVAPDLVARSSRLDADRVALLAEYDARRSKAPYKADDQVALAGWCEEKGLVDQARAHLVAATRIDPSRDSAWKRLGYRKVGKGWATEEQVAASKAEAEAQKAADRRWKPLLDRWKKQLDTPKRDEARAALAGVTDPRAVPTIAQVFVTPRADDQRQAVETLGQVAGPEASRVLAGLAVFSPSPEVRRVAVETLRHRDPRDFVHLWVPLVRSPIKYEVQSRGGPGQPGVLFVEGKRSNTRRLYGADRPPALLSLPNLLRETMWLDKDGLPVVSGLAGWGIDTSRFVYGGPAMKYDLNDPRDVQAMTYGEPLPLPLNAPDPTRAKLAVRQAFGDGPLGTALGDHLPAQSAPMRPTARDFDPNYSAQVFGFAPANPYDQQMVDRPVPLKGFTTFWNEFGERETINPNAGYFPILGTQVTIPVGRMMADEQRASATVQQQMDRDVAVLDRINAGVRDGNEPVLAALRAVTSHDLGDDAPAWSRWWTDQLGYAMAADNGTATPTVTETVPLGFNAAAPSVQTGVIGLYRHHSCFAAGTPVRTLDGSRPIESIERGDLVLTQDTRSGALSYRPVLTAYHNPPSATCRVDLGGGEPIRATCIHRFWVAGRGWVMARDLAPGDPVRVVGGVARVASVRVVERAEPVFNLEVADGRSFFVGELAALVHDNSLVEATPEPFDAPARPAVDR